MTKVQRDILDRLKDIERRLSVLEAMPRPIIFAIGKYPDHVEADMQEPSDKEH